MALMSAQATARGLTDSDNYLLLHTNGLYHPSYVISVSIPSIAKPGVQKQAAENFKWGR